MGHIEYSPQDKRLTAYLEDKQDLQILRTAFKATLLSDDLAAETASEYSTPLAKDGNICALWATGFDWSKDALMAVVDSIMPAVQRRHLFNASALKAKEQAREAKAAEESPS